MTYIQSGDKVRCKVDGYAAYNWGDTAIVNRVDRSSTGNLLVYIDNPFSPTEETGYYMHHWEFVSRPKKKDETVKQTGYVKTKFFGMQTQSRNGEIDGFINPLPLYDTREEAIQAVQSVIQEGEQWVILETKGFLTVVPPKPPLPEVQMKVCK